MSICQKMDQFAFIQKLSTTSQNLINEHAKHLNIGSHQTLIQKGDQVGGVYLVQSGNLRIFHINANGQETTFYHLKAGESCILALNCVFSDIRYPAWVESADHSCEVLMIPPAIFKCLFETEELIKKFVFESLSRKTFHLMEMLEERVSLSIDQRIANFLMTRSNDQGELFITQQELSNHIGSPREVVARTLSKYAKEGWISTQRGVIHIQDYSSLRKELLPE